MKRKFKRLLSVILCVAVTVSAAISGTAVFAAGIDAWDGTRAESYAGGSGTAEDPYLISTPEQLALLVCSLPIFTLIIQRGQTGRLPPEAGTPTPITEGYALGEVLTAAGIRFTVSITAETMHMSGFFPE